MGQVSRLHTMLELGLLVFIIGGMIATLNYFYPSHGDYEYTIAESQW